ncbi:MAG: tRNA (adenosine(37)-N6)-threonylcarbamoyltransferase complex ATPase subunit type 1 TsaE [Cyclobacteriaceae bacterium]|nr:tRNA (adenosine(37)-N6)-threonylcarbamoyltransferase complex ATPase subunit type 1 TsaE [Cyclobacteriaceae bacterium]
MQFSSESLSDLPSIAEAIAEYAGDERVWLFEGDLGAGKTTLIKSICKAFQCSDTISSPTFSLINVYYSEMYGEIYHFDLYRINSVEEILDIGADEYLDSGNYCFVEWPDKLGNLVPVKHLHISVEIEKGNRRIINLTKYE